MREDARKFEDLSDHLLKKYKEDYFVFLISKEKSDTTITTYKSILNRYIKSRKKYKTYFDFENCKVAGNVVAMATYNVNLSVIKSFSFYLNSKINKTSNNPFFSLDKQPVRKTGNRDFLNEDEVKNLLRITGLSLRDSLIIRLASTRALRLIEISRLKVSDFVNYEGYFCLLIHGKGKNENQKTGIKINDDFALDIRALIKSNVCSKENYPIFQSASNSTRGEYLKPKNIWVIIRKAIKEVSDRQITPHSLRHSAGAMLLKNLMSEGIDEDTALEQCRKLLRHKNVQTTRNSYIMHLDQFLRLKHSTFEDRIDQILAS